MRVIYESGDVAEGVPYLSDDLRSFRVRLSRYSIERIRRVEERIERHDGLLDGIIIGVGGGIQAGGLAAAFGPGSGSDTIEPMLWGFLAGSVVGIAGDATMTTKEWVELWPEAGRR